MHGSTSIRDLSTSTDRAMVCPCSLYRIFSLRAVSINVLDDTTDLLRHRIDVFDPVHLPCHPCDKSHPISEAPTSSAKVLDVIQADTVLQQVPLSWARISLGSETHTEAQRHTLAIGKKILSASCHSGCRAQSRVGFGWNMVELFGKA